MTDGTAEFGSFGFGNSGLRSIEDQIVEYFDGGLSDAERAELLHRASVSPEIRDLFGAHEALRGMAQKAMLSTTIAPAVEDRLLATIEGLAAAAAPVQKGFWLWKNPLIRYSVAALLVGGLSFSIIKFSNNPSANSAKNSAPSSNSEAPANRLTGLNEQTATNELSTTSNGPSVTQSNADQRKASQIASNAASLSQSASTSKLGAAVANAHDATSEETRRLASTQRVAGRLQNHDLAVAPFVSAARQRAPKSLVDNDGPKSSGPTASNMNSTDATNSGSTTATSSNAVSGNAVSSTEALKQSTASNATTSTTPATANSSSTSVSMVNPRTLPSQSVANIAHTRSEMGHIRPIEVESANSFLSNFELGVQTSSGFSYPATGPNVTPFADQRVTLDYLLDESNLIGFRVTSGLFQTLPGVIMTTTTSAVILSRNLSEARQLSEEIFYGHRFLLSTNSGLAIEASAGAGLIPNGNTITLELGFKMPMSSHLMGSFGFALSRVHSNAPSLDALLQSELLGSDATPVILSGSNIRNTLNGRLQYGLSYRF